MNKDEVQNDMQRNMESEDPGSVVPSDEIMEQVADLFKKFDDFTRVKIMFLLSSSEMCVEDLTRHLKMSQPAVSNHLRVLKQANLVRNRKQGKNVFYSLADAHVETILNQGLDHVLE